MKKFVRYVALMLALVTLLAPPVSADDFDSQWISIFSLCSSSSVGNVITFKGSARMDFQLAESVYFRRFQGLISANFSNLTSLSYSITPNGTKYPLTLVDVGSGLYRFYSDSVGQSGNTVYLHFQNTSANESTTLEVVSFDYSPLRFMSYAEKGVLTIGSSPSYSMSTPTSTVKHEWSSNTSGSFVAHFTCPDWKKYDSVSFFIYGFGPDINSVVGRMGNVSIPADVTYLNAANWNDSRFSVMVTLDLSGVDRNSTTVPEVEIDGFRRTTSDTFFISLLGVTGYVSITDNSDSAFLRQISARITSI